MKRLTVDLVNGVEKVIDQCGRVYVEDGVLKAFVEDTSYTGHTVGFPLANVWAYKVEER